MLASSVIIVLVAAAPALPEGGPDQDGLRMRAEATVAQVRDDGLAPPDGSLAEPLLTRLSPQLLVTYGGPRLTLLSSAAVDAELVDAHPERSSPWTRRTAALQLHAVATERLTFSAGASYWDTPTPRDLALVTGFDPGRVELQTLQADSGIGWRLTKVSDATAAWSINRTIQQGLTIDTQLFEPGLRGRLDDRDLVRFDVRVRSIRFLDHFSTRSVAPMLGWERQLIPQLSLALEGGPRLTDGSLDELEAAASLQLETRPVRAVLAYARSQSAVPGLIGALNVQSLSATALAPVREKLMLNASASIFSSVGAPLDVTVYQLGAGLTWQLQDSMAAALTWRHAWQSEVRGPEPPGVTGHDVLVIALTLGAMVRRERQPGVDKDPGPVDGPEVEQP